jgi:hypothetical protein
MWKSFLLTVTRRPATTPAKMGVTPISGMLSAAGHLCWAADCLRAAGFLRFAEEIDSLLKILDAEICVTGVATSQPPAE